jgi:putative flippase GtrA
VKAALAESMPAFGRFLIAGLINTAVTWALYLALLLVLPYLAAYTTAYMLGVGVGYVLNAAFVFRVRLAWRGLLRMPLVYGAQLLTGNAVLWFAVSKIGVDRRLALLASIAVSVPLTFALSRFLLARRDPPEQARPGTRMQEGNA